MRLLQVKTKSTTKIRFDMKFNLLLYVHETQGQKLIKIRSRTLFTHIFNGTWRFR